MDAWISDLGLPSEPPGRRDNNRDKEPESSLSFTNGGGESLSTSSPSSMKSSSNADMVDILQIALPYADLAAAEAGQTIPVAAATTAVAARTHDEHDVTVGEPEAGPLCRHKYLVMGRLFKLHADFDAAIEGVLEGDKDGCVILIHETKDEEWTRVVWSRLRDVLAPRGRTFPTCVLGLFFVRGKEIRTIKPQRRRFTNFVASGSKRIISIMKVHVLLDNVQR